jgi:hypothetical protein
MRTPGKFPKLTIKPDSSVVGVRTDYKVVLTAAIPLHDRDQLVIDFPSALGAPGGEDNFCEPSDDNLNYDVNPNCVKTAKCSSARGSITVQIRTKTTDAACTGIN